MFKKVAIKLLTLSLCLGFAAQASAISKQDLLSQEKYGAEIKKDNIVVDLSKESRLDQEAFDGILLPYSKAKIYVEHNEQFTKPIIDGIVDAVSNAIDCDLYKTQYEMEGLVETYKDYYNAPKSSQEKATRHFGYYKLDTEAMRTMAKAANTDYIIYTDIVPLFNFKFKNFDEDELKENGFYDYDDIAYYHGGNYNVSVV